MSLPDAIGWTATAVFTASYFAQGPARLRRIQMAGASLWLSYGLATHAAPVVGANALVLGAACWAEYRDRRGRRHLPASVADSPMRADAAAAHIEAA